MTIRHMRIFVAVCESNCSITKAAEKLNMTQPAVSLAVSELENYYGVKLFDRISRRLYLSEAGKL
ncbi:MAG: LysR family transcriptional regulator, partial [Eubacteriales bacterium]